MAVGHQALEQLPRLLPLQQDLNSYILHTDVYLDLDIYIYIQVHLRNQSIQRIYTSLVTKSLKLG